MARLLIVNADDLGYDPAIDRGILRAARDGIVTSTTAMVNFAGVEDVLREAAAVPGLGIGLHVNLARGPSLAGAPSLLGADGLLDEAAFARFTAEDVAKECEAQLQRFVSLTSRKPTHLDVHKHLHRHGPVLDGVVRVARAHDLPVRAIDKAMREQLRASGLRTTDRFVGDTGPTAYWSPAKLLEELERLPHGTTELMCHPGYRPERTPTGYGEQREGELAALTDPAVVQRARRSDVRLATFAELQF